MVEQQHRLSTARRGLTLVELLMVIAVMTILMAVAIPLVRPAFEDRQLREAARLTNTFFAGAQARAAETGRPVGVWIEAMGDPTLPNARYAVRLHLAEVAPSFTGTTLGARCTVEYPPSIAPPAPPRPNPPWTDEFDVEPLGQLYFWQPDGSTPDVLGAQLLSELVAPFEKFYLRFDHKGPYHPCLRGAGTVFYIALPFGVPPGTEHIATPSGVRPVGQIFEIVRGPHRSIVSPLTLPADAVIDLSVSGVGVGTEANAFAAALPGSPVVIMFTPNGTMGVVYVNHVAYPPTAAVHLLIGRRAKAIDPISGAVANPEQSNLADPANLWLTINHRTGAVTTEDNASTLGMAASVPLQPRIRAAREFARSSQQKGGR